MTTALEGGEGSASRPGRSLLPGKIRYPLWVGPRNGLDRCGKFRHPPAFDPRTVQSVASRYTHYATRPTKKTRGYWKLKEAALGNLLGRGLWTWNKTDNEMKEWHTFLSVCLSFFLPFFLLLLSIYPKHLAMTKYCLYFEEGFRPNWIERLPVLRFVFCSSNKTFSGYQPRHLVERHLNQSFENHYLFSKHLFTRHQLTVDENGNGSRNVGLHAVQPNAAAGSSRKFFCIQSPWMPRSTNVLAIF